MYTAGYGAPQIKQKEIEILLYTYIEASPIFFTPKTCLHVSSINSKSNIIIILTIRAFLSHTYSCSAALTFLVSHSQAFVYFNRNTESAQHFYDYTHFQYLKKLFKYKT